MSTLVHPFRVGDRVRYLREKAYGTANLVNRLHCVSRAYWGSASDYGRPMPMIELLGVENKIARRHGLKDFSATSFVLVSRPGGVTA